MQRPVLNRGTQCICSLQMIKISPVIVRSVSSTVEAVVQFMLHRRTEVAPLLNAATAVVNLNRP